MGARKDDPFHPPLIKLPWLKKGDMEEASKTDSRLRLILLKKTNLRLAWLVAAKRGLANPCPTTHETGKRLLEDAIIRMERGVHPTLGHKQGINSMDWKRPCKEYGCPHLAKTLLGPWGWCKYHQGGYLHAQRMWYEVYRDVDEGSADDARALTYKDRADLKHQKAVRNSFRRKKRNK